MTEQDQGRVNRSDNPLIVQGDLTVLVEVDSPRYAEARDALVGFAELVKSPEHVHTYRITPLSIWNARATGNRFASRHLQGPRRRRLFRDRKTEQNARQDERRGSRG